MSENTKIEWATHSWNPWLGCTKVSPGCLNCYAENSTPTRVARKAGRELWGKGKARQRTSASYWSQALRWNRQATLVGENHPLYPIVRPRIFPSLCDWLDDEVPAEWLAEFCRLMMQTPNLDWLLLSKRPENWSDRLHAAMRTIHDAADDWISGWLDGVAPANVWIGTSVEDQTRADERIPELLKIPAVVRFLSVEPLLGPVNLEMALEDFQPLNADLSRKPSPVQWVIIGGESGPGARPCNVEWIRDIVRQCKAAGVPCFVKQLGSKPMEEVDGGHVGVNDFALELKHPKGGDPAEWPEDLRVREFPKR